MALIGYAIDTKRLSGYHAIEASGFGREPRHSGLAIG